MLCNVGPQLCINQGWIHTESLSDMKPSVYPRLDLSARTLSKCLPDILINLEYIFTWNYLFKWHYMTIVEYTMCDVKNYC